MFGLGRIFGGEKAGKELIGGIRAGLDALVYTEEEKAQAAAQDRAEGRKMFIAWIQATSAAALARRVLAFAIIGTWLLMYFLAVVAAIVAAFKAPETFKALSETLYAGASGLNFEVSMITGYYFAAPQLDKIIDRALRKREAQQ